MAKKSSTRSLATAETMAAKQRDISVSEFFAKNRHLLGFDNPRKALLTTIKEAVDNALDACEEAGILPDIEVKIEEITPPPSPQKAGRYRVTVTDNGPGIPSEIQKRIIEPFFTTKDVGEGTGVGLAFSHRIVQSHDGVLDLVSAPGKGTSFFVRLRAAAEFDERPEASDQKTQVMGVQSVLVVDDEEGVARLLEDVLSEDGFIVSKTTSPREALTLASTQDFDVILSDFKMPDMDGRAFYNALLQLAPKAASKIAFVTGDAMSANVAAFFAASGRPHIEKPIVKSELMALLRQASNSGEAPQ